MQRLVCVSVMIAILSFSANSMNRGRDAFASPSNPSTWRVLLLVPTILASSAGMLSSWNSALLAQNREKQEEHATVRLERYTVSRHRLAPILLPVPLADHCDLCSNRAVPQLEDCSTFLKKATEGSCCMPRQDDDPLCCEESITYERMENGVVTTNRQCQQYSYWEYTQVFTNTSQIEMKFVIKHESANVEAVCVVKQECQNPITREPCEDAFVKDLLDHYHKPRSIPFSAENPCAMGFLRETPVQSFLQNPAFAQWDGLLFLSIFGTSIYLLCHPQWLFSNR